MPGCGQVRSADGGASVVARAREPGAERASIGWRASGGAARDRLTERPERESRRPRRGRVAGLRRGVTPGPAAAAVPRGASADCVSPPRPARRAAQGGCAALPAARTRELTCRAAPHRRCREFTESAGRCRLGYLPVMEFGNSILAKDFFLIRRVVRVLEC